MLLTTGGNSASATIDPESATQFVFLTGCDWDYGTDHWVMKILADSMSQTSGNTLTISGSGLMENEHGQYATVKVDVGALCDASGDRTYVLYPQQLSASDISGPISIKYDLLDLPTTTPGSDGWNATYFITDFDVFYPDSEDHHIGDFGTGGPPISGTDMVEFNDTDQYIKFNTSIYMEATSDTADSSSSTTCVILLWKENT